MKKSKPIARITTIEGKRHGSVTASAAKTSTNRSSLVSKSSKVGKTRDEAEFDRQPFRKGSR